MWWRMLSCLAKVRDLLYSKILTGSLLSYLDPALGLTLFRAQLRKIKQLSLC